jgi:hypothetical protein
MPWSQMIKMNCSPPRASDRHKVAKFPIAKPRELNNVKSNIGSVTRRSMTAKATRTTSPPMRHERTKGLVQPIAWPPYGCRPHTMPVNSPMRPMAKVKFPIQSMLAGVRAPLSLSLAYDQKEALVTHPWVDLAS